MKSESNSSWDSLDSLLLLLPLPSLTSAVFRNLRCQFSRPKTSTTDKVLYTVGSSLCLYPQLSFTSSLRRVWSGGGVDSSEGCGSTTVCLIVIAHGCNEYFVISLPQHEGLSGQTYDLWLFICQSGRQGRFIRNLPWRIADQTCKVSINS